MTSAESHLPWWLRRFGAIGIILLAAFGSHSWMMNLEFQLDDWEQISDAMHPSVDAVLLGKDSRNQKAKRGRPTFVAFFRPVLFASMWLDVQLFGSNPRGHHTSSIVYHMACVLLFYLSLLRILPLILTKTKHKQIAFLAFCSALIFAIHPGCWGAVSWVAARGDILATFLFLLATRALISHREHPSPKKVALLFGFLLLALLAKEGAIICGPILAFLDYFILRHRGPELKRWNTFKIGIPLILLVPAYMYFRIWMFGPLANLYAGHVRVINMQILERTIIDFFRSFPHVAGGYFYCDKLRALEILQRVSVVFMFIMSGFWIMRRPVKRTLGFLFLLGLFTISVAPAMRFYREASGFDASRLFYLPFVFVSLIIAIPMQLLMARIRLIRSLTFIWLLVSIVTWSWGAYHATTSQLRAAEIIARVRQDVRAFSQRVDVKDPFYVVFRLPTEVGNVALYGTFLNTAFTADFMKEPIFVRSTWSKNLRWELREGQLFDYPFPVQFLEWVDDERDGGHLKPMTRVLLGPIGYKPLIPWPQGQDTVKLEQKVHPRDIRSLKVNFKNKPKDKFAFKLVFRDDRSEYVVESKWNPKMFGTGDHMHFYFVEEADWLFLGGIQEVEFVPVSGKPPTITSIDFGSALPKITTTIPNRTPFPIGGSEPEIRFKEEEPCPWYRVRVFFGIKERSWTFPRAALLQENGELAVRLSKGGYFKHEFAIGWEDLKKNSVSKLDLMGLTQLPFRYKIEGLRGQIDAQGQPQSTSAEASFLITR